jgi:hypothetical protein
VKRTSQRAIRLSRSLVKQGYNVTPRRLERWCTDGLGPLEDEAFNTEMEHFAKVAVISVSGRDADTTARRLAPRGQACKRLRPALLRELGIDPESGPSSVPVIDLSSGPSGDPGFAAVEHLAEWMSADTSGLPPLMVKVVHALRRNAGRRAEEIGEPAECIFKSFIVNALCHLMGDDYYNGSAIEAVMNLDPGEMTPDALHVINTELRIDPRAFEESYRQVPLTEIVTAAKLISERAPAFFEHLGVTGVDQDEIDDLAATFAPPAVYLVGLLGTALADVPEEITVLPAPSSMPELMAEGRFKSSA